MGIGGDSAKSFLHVSLFSDTIKADIKRGGITMIACPDCGSALEFDVAKQKLKCPSCRQEYGVTSVKDNTESADTFNVFRCSQCGGEVYSNDNTIAGFCSYAFLYDKMQFERIYFI